MINVTANSMRKVIIGLLLVNVTGLQESYSHALKHKLLWIDYNKTLSLVFQFIFPEVCS